MSISELDLVKDIQNIPLIQSCMETKEGSIAHILAKYFRPHVYDKLVGNHEVDVVASCLYIIGAIAIYCIHQKMVYESNFETSEQLKINHGKNPDLDINPISSVTEVSIS